MLAEYNLKLDKIISNHHDVTAAFPVEERASSVQSLDLYNDNLPAQHSLGVFWQLDEDTFTFQLELKDKPYTRRGVLSVINSIFDPLGIVAPVTIKKKSFFRNCRD